MRKQTTTLLALAAWCVTIAAGPAFAQSSPTQAVAGQAEEQYQTPFGSDPAGSNVSGWSGASYDVKGLTAVSGDGVTSGAGQGAQKIEPNSAASAANSQVNSNVSASGDFSKISVAGGAAQGNWANTGGSGNNFAGGYNTTSGAYGGTVAGVGPLNADGNAGANGMTIGSVVQGPNNNVAAKVASVGQSDGHTSLPSNASVKGYGIGAAGAMLGDPAKGTSFSGGTVQGTANYAGAGGQQAAGALYINGVTMASMDPGHVGATSTVSSSAQGSGSGTSGKTGCGCSH